MSAGSSFSRCRTSAVRLRSAKNETVFSPQRHAPARPASEASEPRGPSWHLSAISDAIAVMVVTGRPASSPSAA